MAQSPATEEGPTTDYQQGLMALHHMIREGMSLSGREKNCTFLNVGDGTFADISALSGLGFLDDGRAVASVDWDMDGRLDLWVANRSGPQLRFMRNQSTAEAHWVALDLQGTRSNRDAIGARVEVRLGGEEARLLVRGKRAGEGFLAQSSAWVHVGLGAAESIEELTVRWPDGQRESFGALAVDKRWQLVEGSGEARAWEAPPRELALEARELEPPKYVDRTRTALFARLPLPTLEYTAANGQPASSKSLAGRPLLITLWASWCAPCLTELRELQSHADDLRARGLDVLALSVDAPEDRADAAAALEGLGWGFGSGYVDAEVLETLDLFQKGLVDRKRRLAVPTSFLVDRKQFVAALYRGPVDLELLGKDIATLDIAMQSVRDAVAPRPGRWRAPFHFPGPTMLEVARNLRRAGLLAAAADYLHNLRLAPQAAEDPAIGPLFGLVVQEGRQLAEELREAGLNEEAAGVLEQVVAMRPAAARVRLELAQLLGGLGRHRDSVPHYRILLERQPGNVGVHLVLARALLLDGDEQGGVTELQRILERNPEQFRAHLELAILFRTMGRQDEAAQHLRRALEIRPGHPEALAEAENAK